MNITDYINDMLSNGHTLKVTLSTGDEKQLTPISQEQLEDSGRKLPDPLEVEGFYQVEIDEKNVLIRINSIVSVDIDDGQPGIDIIN